MADFIYDIEVKVTAKPVNPKVGTTQRGPFERNLFVVRETKKVGHYNVAKTAAAGLVANAMAAIAEQQALGNKPPKVVGVTGTTAVGSTTATIAARGDNQGVSTVVTCEYGTSPETLGSSQAATVSPDLSADGTDTNYTFNLTTLTASTKYYYRIKVSSVDGDDFSILKSFTTTA